MNLQSFVGVMSWLQKLQFQTKPIPRLSVFVKSKRQAESVSKMQTSWALFLRIFLTITTNITRYSLKIIVKKWNYLFKLNSVCVLNCSNGDIRCNGWEGWIGKRRQWTCMAIIVDDYLGANDCQYLFTWQCFANKDLRGNDCQGKEEADEWQVDC